MAKKTSGRRSASKAASKDDDSTKRVLNCVPSADLDSDWQYHNAEDAGVLAAAPVPSSKDLRDETWWKIGDQGTTGSCVGWATADAVLRWHFVQAGRIEKTDVLSTRFQWMAAKETDQFDRQPTSFIETAGTSIKSALEVARKWGAVQDRDLPFKSGRLYRGEQATFYAIATQLKIASYFNLGRSLSEWRSWLARNGPIVTRLDVDSTWDAATANKGKLTTYRPSTKHGGHAVALVGYTSTGFIVRNSWGTGWGDGGYAYASNAYAGKAFTEAYGVSA
ncbi:MAG TPA: C1 family peptidase [Jiangellaceae bacterium]|jgi:C1A family cysteine protease|nr:C1 family peptidase [Jiangellaceae bacterium]